MHTQSVRNIKRFAHLPRLSAHEVGRPKFRMSNPWISTLGDFRVDPAYDGYFIAAGTACNKQTLFAIPQNNPFTIPGGATFTKTLQTTSMSQSAQFPSPSRMLVRDILVYTDNSMNQADVAQLASQTIVLFRIGEKPFLTVGLAGKLTAGGGVWAQQTIGAAATGAGVLGVTNFGVPSTQSAFSLVAAGASGASAAESFPEVQGILIGTTENFSVDVDPTQAAHINAPGVGFTAAATTDYSAGIGVNLWVYLEGTTVKAVR
jgi:hypothetical protein